MQSSLNPAQEEYGTNVLPSCLNSALAVTFNMLYLKTKTFANLKNNISKGFFVGRLRYLTSV